MGETRPRGTCAHGANGVTIVRCILAQRRDLTSAVKPCVIRKSDESNQLQVLFSFFLAIPYVRKHLFQSCIVITYVLV